jgi:two-component system NtrC family sensor kinase
MKRILCLLLLFLIVSLLFAQDKKLAEQLRLELKSHPQQDSTRVKRLIELSWAEIDLDEKERWGREALALAEKIGFEKGKTSAILYLVDALTAKEQIREVNSLLAKVDSIGKANNDAVLRAEVAFKKTNIRVSPNANDAKKYVLQAVEFAKRSGNLEILSRFQHAAGTLYMYSFGDYPKAMELLMESEKNAEKINNKRNLAYARQALAFLYTDIGDQDKAMAYYQQAYEANKDLGESELAFNLLNSIGETHRIKGEYAEALAVYKKNLAGTTDPYFIGIAEGHIAAIYVEQDSLPLAFQYAFSALKQAEKMEDTQVIAWMDGLLARAYLKRKIVDSALYHAAKGLTAAEQTGYLQAISDNAEVLADAYVLKGDFKNAYTYRNIFTTYRDSVSGAEVKNKGAVIAHKYELEKKQAQITALSEQQKLQRVFLISVSIALLLIIITAIALLRNNRQKRLALVELKETQAQLIQSEKMASLGELTAGIAHEIQNPLNFVNNFSELNEELIEELKSEKSKLNNERDDQLEDELLNDIASNMGKIVQHGKRADAIVKGMLQHSRKNSGEKEPTDINALADEYLKLAYHGLRARDKNFNATLKTDFDTSIAKINIIPQDIGKVLLNLYNNAFYTVNEKKQTSGDTYEPFVFVSTKRINDKIKIIVKDNGKGISKNIIDKIFQPFFTTKPTGQGTGLGLSLSYDIVKAHRGELKAEAVEHEGSAFTIQLPAIQ